MVFSSTCPIHCEPMGTPSPRIPLNRPERLAEDQRAVLPDPQGGQRHRCDGKVAAGQGRIRSAGHPDGRDQEGGQHPCIDPVGLGELPVALAKSRLWRGLTTQTANPFA